MPRAWLAYNNFYCMLKCTYVSFNCCKKKWLMMGPANQNMEHCMWQDKTRDGRRNFVRLLDYDKCYIFLVCVCCRRCAARNAQAQYCHLWPVELYIIFPCYLINGKMSGKKVIEHKMFWFSLKSLSEHFSLSEQLSEIWYKYKMVFTSSTRYSCRILTKLKFSWHNFET
jgi:hypothetical protein